MIKEYVQRFLLMLDVFGFSEKDPFGNFVIVKRILIGVLAFLTYSRFVLLNRIKIEGTEHLEKLPQGGVLFLSNHQTYFADVITFYHIFCSVKWGFRNTLSFPVYMLAPRARSYYVAAAETMKEGGLIPKIFAQAGAITVERSWRAQGENVKRELDNSAGDRIGMALADGWVISFPQGTTKPFAPLRKGTGHLIKEHNPIVVPVVIDGYRRAFDKKGLLLKKRNTQLSVKFKEPIRFGADESVEDIVKRLEQLIEQENIVG